MENNGGESPSKVKKATDFFPNKAHVTDALRTILARLDASDPVLVYEKHMPPSDRSKGQNRLLMSCKCESKRAAFASIFTETEMPLVHRPEPLKTEDEKHDSKDKGKGKKKKKDGGADNKVCCGNKPTTMASTRPTTARRTRTRTTMSRGISRGARFKGLLWRRTTATAERTSSTSSICRATPPTGS
jgi:hypothetical protein